LIIGFLVLPLVWSFPEALVTAELATAFPKDAGYVAWVTAAFGLFWGFQVGNWALPGVSGRHLGPCWGSQLGIWALLGISGRHLGPFRVSGWHLSAFGDFTLASPLSS
jgi:amino acid transporter